MDRTLKRAKRNNKRRGQRNHRAWQRFAPDGKSCRYCPHDGSEHLCQSGQPHFFRPATEAEQRRPIGHALPPQAAGGRFNAGAAHDRRQAAPS